MCLIFWWELQTTSAQLSEQSSHLIFIVSLLAMEVAVGFFFF